MGLDYQTFGSEDRDLFEELIACAGEIERKFQLGKARDIRPEYLQNIIQMSILLRTKCRDTDLIGLFTNIENFAYATQDNTSKPDYYNYLRYLTDFLASLENFR